MMRSLLFALGLICILFTENACQESTAETIDFNSQIRPILNEKCLSCHGGVKKNGGLGLRFREEALAPAESGLAAIIPGDAAGSELIKRLCHPDPEIRMPLEQDPLTDDEVKLLESWVEQGAPWETHWAFLPPKHRVSQFDEWGNNAIDTYVGQRLEEEGLNPAPPASKEQLIRRLSLDLIGLPPSPEAVQAFREAADPQAYERLVDQLLSSPSFGERWASMWLDLARYADSQGYQKDRFRSIWRYRDWVIKAFNEDMPFDQFTIEQLAGDLLPNPSPEQMIATAFHRNTMSNDEGGTDDEEFRVTAVIDRVNTTMEVWQGMTIGCVQCHHHPYDPIQHQEFYELYAFFNTSRDRDLSSDYPRIKDWESEQEQASMEDWITKDNTPIMLEQPDSAQRTTRVFERGNWLVHGDTVHPQTPLALGRMETKNMPDRLALAQWLMSEENPLTSRVIANRIWEQIFGRGIVATTEDFGTQGEPPSHPELLDHIALSLRDEHRWHLKAFLKEIVMSATYQQSSSVPAELAKRDPYNILLARGPRVRLSAEQLRDQALAVSGLLSDKQYGPSVMPPQPEGTWQVIRNVLRWQPSEGEDRYRRGLYTFWRRSSPYPSMLTFDAPSREFCVSRRIRTNTPLQALVTLNDSAYFEAAIGLAERMYREGGTDIGQQVSWGYELAVCRPAGKLEQEQLIAFYQEAFAYYQQSPAEIQALIPKHPTADAQLAALVNVANVILNLDEVITKT
ncbi:MAG: PSD1 and planctomycete cytochrome C domain-containing protein [Bacteroidota bacterium]